MQPASSPAARQASRGPSRFSPRSLFRGVGGWIFNALDIPVDHGAQKAQEDVRIAIEGHTDATAEGRALNRRVEASIIK